MLIFYIFPTFWECSHVICPLFRILGGTQRWSEGGGDEHKGATHQARLLRDAAVTQGRPTQQGGVGELRRFFVRFFLR